MYIETVPNRHSRPTILLREAWREGQHVRKRTLANLTHWPAPKIDALRLLLHDVPLVPLHSLFMVEHSLPHGAVEAIVGTMRHLGLDVLLASKPCRERQLVLAMIAERLLHPSSKLGTTRLWHTTTLAEELGVATADADDLYATMDWLLARQARIEQKLAKRHLSVGSHVLYDVTSSYDEGSTCPLARFGYNRDQKQGTTSIVYGVLTDRDGRPIAVEAYRGNTADPTTIPSQVAKLRTRFRLERVVLVGDRGTLTQTQIDSLKQYPGLGWIAALRFEAIRKLADTHTLDVALVAHERLAEITSVQFPGERLVACYNPLVAQQRQRKRHALLEATEHDLAAIVREVARRTKTPLGQAEIGKKVGQVLHHYHMAKHFTVQIEDKQLSYARRAESIQREAALDGIYVIRTSEPAERLSAEDTVRGYKNLAVVERLFRTLKGIDILVRPIHHHQEKRVRAHIFLCVLVYYVEWHMRQALAPLLFDDEELAQRRQTRDPVAPAQPSPAAQQKKARRLTVDGLPIHSFHTLLAAL
ncbi:MAG TPA: IS1634 family transposase, partial [Candidatus Saccharimonadia bacterium]|nr:IS1634 family transposase [Candidatus Saccharimonadia bacterium]